MMKSRRLVLLTTAVLLTLLVSVVGLHRSRGRRALQRYKAELIAKGEKLSSAELVRPRVGGVPDSQSKLVAAVAQMPAAKLPPSTLLGEFTYVAPGRARPVWKERDPWHRSVPAGSGLPWIEFATQVAAAEAQLAEIREAAGNPPPDLGIGTNFMLSVPIRTFVSMRTAAQWLGGAALSDVHEGHLDQALTNLEALVGLAQFNRDELTLVAQMIRVAIAGLGLSVTWNALQAEGWTEPQLVRLQKAWQGVDVVGGLERAFVGERAKGTELFSGARRSGMRPPTSGSVPAELDFQTAVNDLVVYPLYRVTSIEEDDLLRLQAMQEAIEAVRAIRQGRPWKEASRGLGSKLDYLQKGGAFAKRFRFMLSAISVPNFEKALDRGVCVEAQRQMTVAALALTRFRALHGRFPGELKELSPAYVEAPTFDPFSGAPLKYRLRPDGTFLLYSVGEDGKDDHGNAETVRPGNPSLWSGRDAVWPQPAY